MDWSTDKMASQQKEELLADTPYGKPNLGEAAIIADAVANASQTAPTEPSGFEFSAHLLLALIRCQTVTEDLLAEFGVSPRRYQTLLLLDLCKDEDGMTVGALGARLSIARHTCSELLKRMEEDGLVARRRDAEDLRVVHIHLAEQGRALLARVANADLRRLDQARADLEALLHPAVSN